MFKRVTTIIDDESQKVILSEETEQFLTRAETSEIMFPHIIEATTNGSKITAIKMFRAISDCSLRDAKAVIDLLDTALKPLHQRMDELTDELMNLRHELDPSLQA